MICDEPAPCLLWGDGGGQRDHCNAHDEDEAFVRMRDAAKDKRKAEGGAEAHANGVAASSALIAAAASRCKAEVKVASATCADWQLCVFFPHGLCIHAGSLRAPL